MNKLEKLKSSVALKYYKNLPLNNNQDLFNDGFDAAIALNLTVLYIRWLFGDSDKVDAVMLKVKGLHPNTQDFETVLYQYWINNIYEP